jgi:hypothetical protein
LASGKSPPRKAASTTAWKKRKAGKGNAETQRARRIAESFALEMEKEIERERKTAG